VKTKKLPAMVMMAAACAFASGPSRGLSWAEWPSLAEGVAGGGIASMGDYLVYAGGTTWRNGEKHYLTDVVLYSPETKRWTAGPALPEPLAYGAYVDGDSFMEIYGGAGQHGVSQTCWRLEPGAREWKQCGVLPRSAFFAVAAAVGKQVYLFGGCTDLVDLSTCTASVLRRDLRGRWTHIADLPDGAVALSAVAELRGRVYLFGGCTANSSGGVENQRLALRYDPGTNTWKRLRSLPVAVRSASAIPLDKNRILIVGGYGQDVTARNAAPGFLQDVWIYNVESNVYERTTPLPFGVAGIALTRYEEGIVGVGGEDRLRGRSARVVHGHFTD
jgi:N-acetylneuraminic acid mutarotase